ncbi:MULTISPECIES: M23 family metallopeptidase [unclassified Microbacterium]|uniref:M23 family metallopeptidase n=1 Tax=unclassified Microbacterium TaxID=2609290 RepID=UPI00301994F8
MRRPVNEPVRITGDRASHAEYGVGPATDYGCDIGTPVLAPFAGWVSTYVTSAGGLGVIVEGADATFYGQHLRVRLGAGHYDEGDRIALSGNSGTQTTGPHLHCYVIVHATGERLAMEEYLARAASVDAQPFEPPTPPKPSTYYLEDTMSQPKFYAKGDKSPEVYAVFTDACDTNNPTQGGAYCARRYVTPGELAGVQAKGEKVVTLSQYDLDILPKVAGSR